MFRPFFFHLIDAHCSTPNVVTTKEHPDNSNSNASEFNPAYSVEITDAKTQGEVDTFDHILQVTSHHEAVVAYYYMDDDNKVCWGIFDAKEFSANNDGLSIFRWNLPKSSI